MAILRVPLLLILLVATAFLATSVAGDPDTAVAAAPVPVEEPFGWDKFLGYQKAQQGTEGTEGTTASLAAPAIGATITVGKTGRYKTVQAAINSISKTNKKRITIYIQNGVYRY
jgi:pectin methylesterase-like acyl-CoA thioesterase